MSQLQPSQAGYIAALSKTQRSFVAAPYSATGVTDSQTNVDLSLAALVAAGGFVFPTAGRAIGFSWELSAAISAGQLSISCMKDGSLQNTTNLTTGQRGVTLFATPVSQAANTRIHFRYTTNVAYTGGGTLVVLGLVVIDV